MNITHTQDNEQQIEEEFSYVTAKSIAKQNEKTTSVNEPLFSKILELLDDSTPNYVLGYN